MNILLKKYWLSALVTLAGAAGGFLYYYFVGCSSGSCPISSNPYMSIVFGALIGILLADLFKKKSKTDEIV